MNLTSSINKLSNESLAVSGFELVEPKEFELLMPGIALRALPGHRYIRQR